MTITYSYEQNLMTVTNGEKKRVAHSIVDGDKGATYYYLHKDNSSFKKVKIVEKEGKFEVTPKPKNWNLSYAVEGSGYNGYVGYG